MANKFHKTAIRALKNFAMYRTCVHFVVFYQNVKRRAETCGLPRTPDQARPLTPTKTIAVEPPVLDKTKKRCLIVIPYVKGVSEQVRRVMKRYRLKMYFKP